MGMNILLLMLAYLAIMVFAIALIYRIAKYARMPVHLRWELYPVAHEKDRPSGGSYLEDLDWWTKPRHKSLFGEIKFMASELFFFTLYYRLNRKYWYAVYPFHLGIFLLLGWLALLLIGAITLIFGVEVSGVSTNAWGMLIYVLTAITGAAGFIIISLSCLGLLLKRSIDRALKLYTTRVDYFNLTLILLITLSGLIAWFSIDPAFATNRAFTKSLLTLTPLPGINPLIYVHILLTCLFIIYMPFTSMMHYVAKYFTFHKVRWDDEPNLGGRYSEKVKHLLKQPTTWSADHINPGNSNKTEH